MKSIPIANYSPDTLESLLSGIPFYKDLIFNDPEQMEELKRHSSIYEPAPGEVVIEKGATDKIFYFLLSGQLVVYPEGGKKSRKAVNYLTPGQALGVLALLCDSPRTATLVADPKSGRVQMIGTDFAPFGELMDLSRIHLPTKLAPWRMVTHNTRWKLNVYRMQSPEHPLSQALAKVETFTGEKGSVEELQSLNRQVRALTELMSRWNEVLASA